jgi:hypothetical protein
MPELLIDPETVGRLLAVAQPHGEIHRQLLGMRLVRRLFEDSEMAVRNPETLEQFDRLDNDPVHDPRYGWPTPLAPDLVELVWPAPPLAREPLEERKLRISPWALHSLLLGDWSTPVPNTVLRLPECVALLMCDGLSENPSGRDLLRVTGRLEVLAVPTRLHSQVLDCGLADGVGQIEMEIQVLGPEALEAAFAIKPVFCLARDVPSFYVANLDELQVYTEGIYWFVLRVLGEELSRLPIEVGRSRRFESRGGWQFGQAWTWEGDVFFGERG